MIAQAVIEEIPLPFDLVVTRQKMFPASHRRFHARLARKGDDPMQMIGHQQQEAAMPGEFLVVMRRGGQHGVAHAGLAKRVLFSRNAVDGDEKERAVANPRRDFVAEPSANGEIHDGSLAIGRTADKPKGCG